MSQSDDSFKEKLQDQLWKVKQNGEQADWLRELVEWIVQELLELEFTENLGAGRYERTGPTWLPQRLQRTTAPHTGRHVDPARSTRSRRKVLNPTVRTLPTE